MIDDNEYAKMVLFYTPYIGKLVGVGCPYHDNESYIFWNFGTVIGVTKSGLHLRSKKGDLMVIKFESIRKISTGVY